jgi:hypothetical protein
MSPRGATTEFVHRPFQHPPDDALAPAHAAVAAWATDAIASLPEHTWYKEAELKSCPSGRALLNGNPAQARDYVMAAVAQLRHLDAEADRVRAQGQNEMERVNAHFLPGWGGVWGRRRQTLVVVDSLMRRTLPLSEADLLALLEWCNFAEHLSAYHAPISFVTRALQRHLTDHPMTPALRAAVKTYATRLRDSPDKGAKRLGTTVEQFLTDAGGGDPADAPAAEVAPPPADARPVAAAPAGHPAVLDQLKRALGIPAADAAPPATEPIGPDRFALRADSPLAAEHAILTALFAETAGQAGYNQPELEKLEAGRALVRLDESGRGRALLAAAERALAGQFTKVDYDRPASWQAIYTAEGAAAALAARPFQLDRDGLFDYLLFVAGRHSYGNAAHLHAAVRNLLAQAEAIAGEGPLTDGERYVLHLLRTWLVGGPPLGAPSDEVARLTRLIDDGAAYFLVPGEAWADAVNADLSRLAPARRAAWVALLRHLLTATAARPAGKWLKAADQLVEAVGGAAELSAMLTRWLPLVARGRTIRRVGAGTWDTRSAGDVMHEENATTLRGLLWLAPTLRSPDLARLVTAVAVSAYRKVPGVGPRAVKVGNAAVYALSEMASEEAVGQLAMLKVRVKFGTAQKEIEKAFNTAAAALGLPREQIEELGVPSYGLEEVGLRRETFGEFVAELRVDGRDAQVAWSRAADGKPQKSVPAKVKAEFKEELKEFQQSAKDVEAMLPAQAERIDSMFLLRKSWPLAAWRERYLDHPLVGTIARRLIWMFAPPGGKQTRAAAWLDGKFVGADDKPVEPKEGDTVSLWHPIGRPVADVLAWRAWLERHRVRQPFKQAHREVYVLTDAERRTGTYSNRFAGHILRQHQFHALCAARGWKNKLRLMVDDTYPPASRDLPAFALRAEYWVEGAGEQYGTDTADSGAYLRLTADQVRFYRTGAAENRAHAGGGGYELAAAGPGAGNVNEPLPLEQVDPLALSEVMRDVDLFVGVASVGNDPTWQDGGPEGRYLNYWQGFSFGELSATAQTRRDVLAGLIPRLKIRDRATLSDRFLVVRGDLRTYKIHLGSGNILMEPNDQYLCIVPDRSAARTAGEDGATLFLPFEGDSTLSVILSKAFLLADDRKITDASITRQIKKK